MLAGEFHLNLVVVVVVSCKGETPRKSKTADTHDNREFVIVETFFTSASERGMKRSLGEEGECEDQPTKCRP